MTDSVTSIGESAFSNCKSLESISIPDSVNFVRDDAFYNCEKLKSAIIGNSEVSVGFAIFCNCLALESVTFKNPDCEIKIDECVINNGIDEYGDWYFNGTIYGYRSSTAQKYAENFGYRFEPLEGEPEPPSNPYIFGDANCDGKFNVSDAAYISKCINERIMGTLTIENSDYNRDGVINVRDCASMLKQLAQESISKKKFDVSGRNDDKGKIWISSDDARPGETVELKINVSGSSKFESADFGLIFDKSLGINQDNSLMINGNLFLNYNVSPDVVHVACFNSGSISDEDILTIELTIPKDAEIGTVYNIDFSEIKSLYLSDGIDITDTVMAEGGTIDVVASPTPIPISTEPIQAVNPESVLAPAVYLSEVKGKPGETVKIDVNVKMIGGIESVAATILYDNELGFERFDSDLYGNIKNKRNSFEFTLIDVYNNACKEGEGVIGSLYFTIPENANINDKFNVIIDKVYSLTEYEGSNYAETAGKYSTSIAVEVEKQLTDEPAETTPALTTTVTTSDTPTTTTSVSTSASERNTRPTRPTNTTKDDAITTTTTTFVSTSASESNTRSTRPTIVTSTETDAAITTVTTASTDVSETTSSTDKTTGVATITTVSTTTVPETTSATTTSVQPVKGDANGDGKLNVRDAAFIANALAANKVKDLPESADYNKDGRVNVRDCAAIARFLATKNK